jgi:hypothetical protein
MYIFLLDDGRTTETCKTEYPPHPDDKDILDFLPNN